MDKAHPLPSSMVAQSLKVKKDPFCPVKDGENFLGLEILYLCKIEALTYLKNFLDPEVPYPFFDF